MNLINPLINNALLLASCVGFSKTKSNVAGDAEKYINVKKKGAKPLMFICDSKKCLTSLEGHFRYITFNN